MTDAEKIAVLERMRELLADPARVVLDRRGRRRGPQRPARGGGRMTIDPIEP